MTFSERMINAAIRLIFTVTCKVDRSELSKIPLTGPGILITNHTTFFEGPLYYVFLRPRKTVAIGKKELWKNPLVAKILDAWDTIPLGRGEGDVQAVRRAVRVLEEGNFLGIAPEGTRSRSGKLLRGKAGAIFLAIRERVPIFPIAQWGLRDLGKNITRFRRTKVNIRVGRPFFIEKKDGSAVTSEDKRKMADEMMYQIAALLPERFRGVYSDLSRMTSDYLTFCD